MTTLLDQLRERAVDVFGPCDVVTSGVHVKRTKNGGFDGCPVTYSGPSYFWWFEVITQEGQNWVISERAYRGSVRKGTPFMARKALESLARPEKLRVIRGVADGSIPYVAPDNRWMEENAP